MNINDFTTHVRDMILQLKELKQQKTDLEDSIQMLEEEKQKISQQLKDLQTEYNSLLMGKVLNIYDNDIEVSKRRINNMIRKVDKCITILSEK